MLFFFFFKQKTAYEMRISDWSSDVCSSDLETAVERTRTLPHRGMAAGARTHPAPGPVDGRPVEAGLRRRCRMNAVATHEHVVAARNLRKAYKTTVALDNADFRIESGKIIGLIGPNGAGKTPAPKAMLGLTPFEGDLKVLGRDRKSVV